MLLGGQFTPRDKRSTLPGVPRPPSLLSELRPLIDDFALRLADVVQARALTAARESALKALSSGARRSRDRHPPQLRKLPMSATRRRALALHGRYMGSLRSLGKAERAKVKARRARNGVDAALKLAASFQAKGRRA